MLAFKKVGDIFNICCNYALFITFLVSLKNKNKINGLQYWVAFYTVHPAYILAQMCDKTGEILKTLFGQ